MENKKSPGRIFLDFLRPTVLECKSEAKYCSLIKFLIAYCSWVCVVLIQFLASKFVFCMYLQHQRKTGNSSTKQLQIIQVVLGKRLSPAQVSS